MDAKDLPNDISTTTITSLKRKRTVLTFEQKLKVIELLEENNSEREIAKFFGAGKTQIHTIKLSKDKIREMVREDKRILKKKVKVDRSFYPKLDKAVFDWFKESTNPRGKRKRLPLARIHIQTRALQKAQLRGIKDFCASDGRFLRWRKRYGVNKSLRLRGEAGDVDMEKAVNQIQELGLKLSEFKPENIFNQDETGLFYRAMPRRTYTWDEITDSRQLGRGQKALGAKDRITLMLCVNAIGNRKISPLIIGSSKKPHCFLDLKCPLPYINQSKAWCDSITYRYWFNSIFLPNIRTWTEEPVALIMDNFRGHDMDVEDPNGQVTIFFLPPNCTSVFQPLDQGVISILKTNYKRKLVNKLIGAYDNFHELQEIAKKINKGRKGIEYGHPAHINDAAKIIDECWKEMDESIIANCWARSQCLSHLPINMTIGESNIDLKQTINEICQSISNLSLNSLFDREKIQGIGLSEISDMIQNQENEKATELLDRWINLEDDRFVNEIDDKKTQKDIDTKYDNLCVQEQQIECDNSEKILEIDKVLKPDEDTIKKMLLSATTFAVDCETLDPVLRVISENLRSYILKDKNIS